MMANPKKIQHTPGTHPAIPLDNYERIHLASPFVNALWGVFQKGVELTLDINSGQQHMCGGFKYFLCSSLFGEMIQLSIFFSKGLELEYLKTIPHIIMDHFFFTW